MTTTHMITVYGTDWCEDTRRARRHLRRLGVSHAYLNVDDDLDALERATTLNSGTRRTPTIDLGYGGAALVEPDNEALTVALVEVEVLTPEVAHELLAVQNVGDIERVARTLAGLALLAAAWEAPRALRWPAGILGALTALTGVAGWCPVYHLSSVTSLGGPGDRPDEALRREWLAPGPAPSPPTNSPAKATR